MSGLNNCQCVVYLLEQVSCSRFGYIDARFCSGRSCAIACNSADRRAVVGSCGKRVYATELASSFVYLGLGLMPAAAVVSSRVARGNLVSN